MNDPSVKGFNLVADKFGSGKVMQTTIVIENNDAMDNNENLAVIDNLTEKLKGIDGINAVAGPTQPKGTMIADLYTNTQTQTVVNGLSSANDGVNQINDGLGTMNNSLSTPDFSAVQALSDGTGSLKDGIDAVTLGEGYASLASSTAQLNQLTAMMQVNINNLDAKLPNDPDVAALNGLNQGSAGQQQVIASMTQLSSGADKIKTGQISLYNGLSSLGSGMTQLKDSIGQSSTGLTAVSNGITKSDNFLTQLTNTKSFYIPVEALNTVDINKMLNPYMSDDRKTAKLTVTLNAEPYAEDSIAQISTINTTTKAQLEGTALADAKFGVAGADCSDR